MNIPDHELLFRIGQGSYGEVWLARTVTGRFRAAKFVFRATFRDAHPFNRELAGIELFEPISRSHAGFVHVLHVGRNDAENYFYYLMEVADDVETGQKINPTRYSPKTLAREITRCGRLGLEECIALAFRLTEALASLHEQGLVHRDIKPANIVFVSGAPKLADIGLVAGINEAHSFVGTEGFIPPEGPGSAQADIFSLGKVLYEAATGQDRQRFPELPADLWEMEDPARFLELNEVIVRAGDPDRTRRYQNARQMLDELQVLVVGQSVRALRRRQAFAKNTRGIVIAAILVAFVFGATYGFIRREEGHEVEKRLEARRVALATGIPPFEQNRFIDSLPRFALALECDEPGSSQTVIDRLRMGATLAAMPRLVQMWPLPRPASRALFSHDGKMALLLSDHVQLLDVDSGADLLPRFADRAMPDLRDAAFSPDDQSFIIAAGNVATLWDRAGARARQFKHPAPVTSVHFDSQGERLLTSCRDGHARLWDIATVEVKREFTGPHGALLIAVLNRNGTLVATGGEDGHALLWEVATGKRVGAAMTHAPSIEAIAFSPDSLHLATAGQDRSVRFWKIPGGEESSGVLWLDSSVRHLEFSADGMFLLTAAEKSKAQIWDAHTAALTDLLPKFSDAAKINWAAFSPDARRIMTSSADGLTEIWDFAPVFPEPELICANGKFENHIDLLNPNKSAIDSELLLKEGLVIRPNNDGHALSAIDPKTSAPTWSLDLPCPANLDSVYFSADGLRLAIVEKKLVHVREISSGSAVLRPLLHAENVERVCFDRSGQKLACLFGHSVQIWDLAPAAPITLIHLPSGGSEISFTDNGARLLTCLQNDEDISRKPLQHPSDVHTSILWNAQTGAPSGHEFQHRHFFAGDFPGDEGSTLLAVAPDQSMRVLDAKTKQPLIPSLSPPVEYSKIQFASAHSAILGIEGDGSRVWRWKLPTSDLPTAHLDLLCAALSRETTKGETVDAAQTIAAWTKLRRSHPQLFQVTEDEISRWHTHLVHEALTSKNWDAALFHLHHLHALAPANESISRQIQELERKQKGP